MAVSLVGVVLWGTLSGSLLPFLLRRLGFDPATSSAPFVATLVDVTGLVIYFSVALSSCAARCCSRPSADGSLRAREAGPGHLCDRPVKPVIISARRGPDPRRL